MDKKLVFLIAIFFLIFSTFMGLSFYRQTQNNPITKATNSQKPPNLNNSLLFSVPKAKNICILHTVVNDDDNDPITGVTVCFQVSSGTINPNCGSTDIDGIVTSELTLDQSLSTINTTINDIQLPKTVICQYSP